MGSLGSPHLSQPATVAYLSNRRQLSKSSLPSTKAGNSGDHAILALHRTTSSAIPAGRVVVSSLLASNFSFSRSNSMAAFLSSASRFASSFLSSASRSALFSSTSRSALFSYASCSAIFSSAFRSASSFFSSAAASHSACSLLSSAAVSRILRHFSIRNLLFDFSSKPKDSTCFFNSSKASETNVAMMMGYRQMISDKPPDVAIIDTWLEYNL